MSKVVKQAEIDAATSATNYKYYNVFTNTSAKKDEKEVGTGLVELHVACGLWHS